MVLGKNNVVHQGAIVGGDPQDLQYDGDPTELHIGDNNTIREYVTINLGTLKDKGITIIGNNNLLMAYVHIAHDCVIHNNVVIANSTQMAGHVVIEDNVTIGGVCGMSQFIRIGKFAYLGGNSTFNKDILPFSIAEGRWGVMRATNKIGLSRNGYEKKEVESIHKALRTFIRGGLTVAESVEKVKSNIQIDQNIQYLLDFAEASQKGLAR